MTALDRIKELAKKATPGPWLVWASTHIVIQKHSGADKSEDLRICECAYNSRNDESRYNTFYIVPPEADLRSVVEDGEDIVNVISDEEHDRIERWILDNHYGA